jgi:serine/threonine-protein kinase HipA
MKKTLMVFLHDKYCGDIHYENGRLSFVYQQTYLEDLDARAISTTMPLGPEIYPHPIVYPFFSGLLPDEGVRHRLARYLQLSEKNTFGLLKAIGGECAGAISVKATPGNIDQAYDYLVLNDHEALEVMHSLQQRPFLVGKEDIRISAAGAQSKLMISFVENHIAIPKGHTPSTHLIKPAIPGFDETVENEYFCMLLAKKIGLKSPDVQILKLIDEVFYVVERYDRMMFEGKIKRLHQEDFCQILNIHPEIKYENEGGPSLKDCFTMMDNLIKEGRMPGIDKLRLLKLVFFNFIIGNTDAHGKNFSILYLDNGITLAPCYDLLSTLVYSEHLKDKMAMKIGGEYNNPFIQKKNWQKLALEIGVKESFLLQQLKSTAELTLKEAEKLLHNIQEPSPIYQRIYDVIVHQVKGIQKL